MVRNHDVYWACGHAQCCSCSHTAVTKGLILSRPMRWQWSVCWVSAPSVMSTHSEWCYGLCCNQNEPATENGLDSTIRPSPPRSFFILVKCHSRCRAITQPVDRRIRVSCKCERSWGWETSSQEKAKHMTPWPYLVGQTCEGSGEHIESGRPAPARGLTSALGKTPSLI